MPAAVETAVYSNEPAWHRLGTVLDSDGEKGLDIPTAIPASGLDWTVRKVPAFAPVEYEFDNKAKMLLPKPGSQLARVNNRWNVQRESDGHFFGTVGDTWQPVQNVEGFALVDDLIAQATASTGKAWIESAGSLEEGKKVWILVHIENDWQIAGEQYQQYLLFTNGHDGRASVAAATTNVRVVCANTLAWALEGNPRVIRVRHTTKASERIKEAANVLNMRNAYTEQQAIQGEFLAEQDVSEGQVEQFLASLFPIKDDAEDTPAATMATNRRDDVRGLYMSAPNLDPIRGNRWGLLNAAVEYADYGREFKSDTTALKNQFGLVGSGTDLKQRAYSIVKDKDLVLA